MPSPDKFSDELPLVSVVVPSYNHARYIRPCLDSVVQAGWPRIELLILDDASTDNTDEVVVTWLQDNAKRVERVVYWRNETNAGVSATLNRLLRRATGVYVALLASDDVLIRGGLAARVEVLRLHEGRYEAVIGDCQLIDGGGVRDEQSAYVSLHRANMHALRSRRLLRSELTMRWSVPGPALMVRASLIQRYGPDVFDPSLTAEDRDLYLRLLRDDRLTFTPVPVAAYRVHSLSATFQSSRKIEEAIATAESRYLTQMPRHLRALLIFVILGRRLRGTVEEQGRFRRAAWVTYAVAFRGFRLAWAGVARIEATSALGLGARKRVFQCDRERLMRPNLRS